ncbi:hypothetical protein [Microvirga thermotolerans]|uniref:Uncharacterized protein n=1 Tax=Microvirga thermotolerans TaxID=2651334 RepID=A0A5P9JVM8_9HYPH|nr:hypothetical protein [Microvirga thermotolerans]QFU15235.1 hypothetical protein GDR74_02815 [Microvirga thermotolerans]
MQVFASTIVRTMSRPLAQTEPEPPGPGRSRRGFSTKIHKADRDGGPLDYCLNSDSPHFERLLDRGRVSIEQTLNQLKRFKRFALRCEETEKNYGSFVAPALSFILIKSVHTA